MDHTREGREVEAGPRRPARGGTFAVGDRLRIGGLISAAGLVAGVAASGFIVLGAFADWLINGGPTHASVLTALVGLLLMLCATGSVAFVAGSRPGNAALRRRQLAMDDHGLWLYSSALWWDSPVCVPWPELDRIAAVSAWDMGPGDNPAPEFAPWDFLTTNGNRRTAPAIGYCATVGAGDACHGDPRSAPEMDVQL